MQFGLLYDFRNPTPWYVASPDLYAETFDQIRAVESFGFDSIWLTEHHFTDDGYLSAISPVAGAIATITRRVRIGHSVLLLPLHHPLHVAEEGALLDILSGGRFIFGPGLGYKVDEFESFGIDRHQRAGIMDESMELITRAWTEDRVTFRGEHFRVEDIAVTPRPVQQPRPPIWMAARADAPLRRAAKYADGVIAVGSNDLITKYRRFVREAGRDPEAMTVAVLRSVILSEDPGDTWEEVKDHVRWRGERYGQWYGEAGDLPQDRAWLRQIRSGAAEASGTIQNLIKDVPAAIAEVEDLQRAGVDCVIYFATFPGYPPTKMLPTWERFAKEVIPHFRPSYADSRSSPT